MKPAHRCRVVVFALAALAVVGLALPLPTAQAQAPTISSFSPLSLRPGQSQDIVVRGGNLCRRHPFLDQLSRPGRSHPPKAEQRQESGGGLFPGHRSHRYAPRHLRNAGRDQSGNLAAADPPGRRSGGRRAAAGEHDSGRRAARQRPRGDRWDRRSLDQPVLQVPRRSGPAALHGDLRPAHRLGPGPDLASVRRLRPRNRL